MTSIPQFYDDKKESLFVPVEENKENRTQMSESLNQSLKTNAVCMRFMYFPAPPCVPPPSDPVFFPLPDIMKRSKTLTGQMMKVAQYSQVFFCFFFLTVCVEVNLELKPIVSLIITSVIEDKVKDCKPRRILQTQAHLTGTLLICKLQINKHQSA